MKTGCPRCGMDREERTRDNFKPKKKYAPVEVADDSLERVSGGTDNYAVIPNRTDTGNVAVTEDASETTMPVGAITEA